MSLNQFWTERSDAQLRKHGRPSNSSYQRSFSGAGGKGGGATTAPPTSGSSSSSFSSNRSLKKSGNNGQGALFKLPPPGTKTDQNTVTSVTDTMQNGFHIQSSLQGHEPASGADKLIGTPAFKSSQPLPRATAAQSTSGLNDSQFCKTPSKGDEPKGFPLQFGTISPGFVNGMQIPARTSSAPPNLVEQKCDQARHDSLRTGPAVPMPATPKQQPPRNSRDSINQSTPTESHPLNQAKRDAHVQILGNIPSAPTSQKTSVHPIPGMSMAMPYQQQQVAVQFGGPTGQVHHQGVTASSLQMPMPLSVGNTNQVQAPVFVPGLPSHPLQTQGMMHQAQGLGFPPQMSSHPGQQLSNLGMAMSTQFSTQQPGKFSGPRKTTVKITHPETHEELRLDKRADSYSESGSSGARPHSSVPPQSQPIPSFSPSPQINFYGSMQPNYNSSPIFFQTPSSLPMTSTQMTPSTAASRYTYPVGQGGQTVSFMNASTLNSIPLSRSGPLGHGNSEPAKLQSDQPSGSAPAASLQVVMKPVVGSFSDKVTGTSSVTISAPPSKGELLKPQHKLVESNLSRQSMDNELDPEKSTQQLRLVDGSACSEANMEGRRKEHLRRSESLKDQRKKTSRKDPKHLMLEHQLADLPESGESLKSSSLKVSEDDKGINTITDVHSKAASRNDENVESPLVIVESSTAESRTCSLASEDTISSEVGQINAEINPTLYRTETSGGNIDAAVETSQDLHACSCASETETNEVQVGEGDTCEPSNPSGLVMDACENLAGAPNKDIYSTSTVSEYLEDAKQLEPAPHAGVLPIENYNKMEVPDESSIKETEQSDKVVESVDFSSKVSRTFDNLVMSTPTSSSIADNETASLSSIDAHEDKIDSTSLGAVIKVVHEKGIPDQENAMAEQCGPPPVSSEMKSTLAGPRSFSAPGTKDQAALEHNRSKVTTIKKKKRRELLMKADAAGTTFDLYNAFKGPEEKSHQKSAVTQETIEYSPANESDKVSPDDNIEKDPILGEEDGQNKDELDDWEDAAISTPELKGSEKEEHALGARKHLDEYGSGMMGKKKYSRDFLLTISKHCVELPAGFDTRSHLVDRDSYPSSGRIVDRSSGGSRVDRRGGIADDDKWSKSPGTHGAAINFRPGQGVNNGVLRNPRGQPTGQYVGGILSGPMLTPQGGMHRNSPDADWWQRSTGFQKGLMPSPLTPLQVKHKAEKKYEVGKASDEEEAKQRRLKAILNKLTPQNFDKLFEQVKAVNIDNAVTLTGVISQIFDKALMEPTFCEMYADFCFHLAGELPDFNEDNEKITFKRVLLNKCQEEFERGEREQAEANRIEEDGEIKQSEEEREEKKVQARRRMLGNIRLIGELYKKTMLTERIMHSCIKKLLGQYQNPDEEDVEALCKLMTTIGEMIDHPKAKEHMDAYFEMMSQLSTNQLLSLRVRFMLKDAIELRNNKWHLRRKVEGPKKIEEVHRDAAQERQLQTSRLSRGPSMGSSARRGQPPMDYGPQGSNQFPSPGSQQNSGRGFSSQLRGHGAQDVRLEEKPPFERTLSVPLPQRPVDGDSLTLGPQGGLGRRMSTRGQQPIASNIASPELSPGTGDRRRMGSGPNGYASTSDCREEPMLRFSPDRFMNPLAFDQSTSHDRNLSFGNRGLRSSDHAFDRSRPTSPAMGNVQGSLSGAQTTLESEISEDKLQDMSIATIREFYSARNEEEVHLCMKDLKSPRFYPSMVMQWITDSFDRKNDTDRDLLAKLLVNLCKSRDSLLSQAQLIKGFESVLSNLEDTVTDSPKAAEYLGRILGEVVLEKVVPLTEIGRLIHEGGEEPGSLLQSGLAADVLASLLEIIQHERRDPGLMDIRAGSNLRLEDFRPPDPLKACKLDAFI